MKKIFKSIGRYFKGVKKEIGRIRWTTPKDLIKYSTTAVLFMLFLGLYFYAIYEIVKIVRGAM